MNSCNHGIVTSQRQSSLRANTSINSEKKSIFISQSIFALCQMEAHQLAAKQRVAFRFSFYLFAPLLPSSCASASSVLFCRRDQHCYGSASPLVLSFCRLMPFQTVASGSLLFFPYFVFFISFFIVLPSLGLLYLQQNKG